MRLQHPEKLQAAHLNVMNFLNEVTLWYPAAISFAPGRPAERYFNVQDSFKSLSRYVEYLARASDRSAQRVFDQLGQYQKEMLQICAEEYGVICCPMSFFSLVEGCEDQIRLSFSAVSQDEIERGIAQLWQFVHDTVQEHALT